MLVVQKYGGATLANAGRVRAIAERIAERVGLGHRIVAVVSAMGSTTNELIELAYQVTPRPSLRELDMLLTTGERISMSLVSMALHNLGIKATSLTGSQAGIMTNSSHSNAFIHDVKAFRVEEALNQGSVVVLAGFQGVCPETKEITTLGRGGTDTTAIAMAAHLKAHHCEILKEVPAVFSADPRLVIPVQALEELNYEQMSEMTFWGAKVLHHRSVDLAARHQVPVYIGPAHSDERGTWIRLKGQMHMYEKTQILSVNSFEKVLRLWGKIESPQSAFSELAKAWEEHHIPNPQFLSFDAMDKGLEIWLTGANEVLGAIEKWTEKQESWNLATGRWSTVSVTCAGAISADLNNKMLQSLGKHQIHVKACRWSPLSVTYLIEYSQRVKAVDCLHHLITTTNS